MAAMQLVKREQLRFLRDTARRMRELAEPEVANNMRVEMLRLAGEIDLEADEMEVISLRDRDGGCASAQTPPSHRENVEAIGSTQSGPCKDGGRGIGACRHTADRTGGTRCF